MIRIEVRGYVTYVDGHDVSHAHRRLSQGLATPQDYERYLRMVMWAYMNDHWSSEVARLTAEWAREAWARCPQVQLT